MWKNPLLFPHFKAQPFRSVPLFCHLPRISDLRSKPPSQIGLKGIQPPPAGSPGRRFRPDVPLQTTPEILTVGQLTRHQLELAQEIFDKTRVLAERWNWNSFWVFDLQRFENLKFHEITIHQSIPNAWHRFTSGGPAFTGDLATLERQERQESLESVG